MPATGEMRSLSPARRLRERDVARTDIMYVPQRKYILIWLTKLPLTNTIADGIPIYQASVYNIVLRGLS